MITMLRNLLFKKPILVIYDVTKLCNERCPMCNIWKAKSQDMALQEISIKAQQLHKFGIGYVFLQGGEPTLRNDLIDIIDIFISNHIKPTVITNGILLTPQLAQEIGKRNCNLAISVDSLQKEKFKKLRGVDALDKVLENIENIKHLSHKGNWAITTTVSALSEENDILAIEKFATAHGFMHAIRPYIFVSGIAGKKVEEMIGERESLLAIFKNYLKIARETNFIASVIYEEHINYLNNKAMPPCDAMKYSLLMQENGKFSPCIEFPTIEIFLDDFITQQKNHFGMIKNCNSTTPCFYNDAREIGILWRKKFTLLLHAPKILRQLIKYGNFF